jgi:hypothetical protein
MQEKIKKRLSVIIALSTIIIGLNILILGNGIRIKNIEPEWLSYCLTGIVITSIISGLFYLIKMAFGKIIEQCQIISRTYVGMEIELTSTARNVKELRKDINFITKYRQQVQGSENVA